MTTAQERIQQEDDIASYHEQEYLDLLEEQELIEKKQRMERERIDKINAINQQYGVGPLSGGSAINPYIEPAKPVRWFHTNSLICVVSIFVFIVVYFTTVLVSWLMGTSNVLASNKVTNMSTDLGSVGFLLTFVIAKIRGFLG